MNRPPIVQFYLEPSLRAKAETGAHNFIAKMAAVLENARFKVEYLDHPLIPKVQDAPPDTFSLTHMKPPPNARGLVFRRAYQYPFWQIDAVPERWNWDVAKAPFDANTVPADTAAAFYRFWQKRLFGAAASTPERKGFVYVPLQGRLIDHRSFQSCSPIKMLEHTLAHVPDRPIKAALHPKETYTDTELAALEALACKHPRLQISSGEMERHLQGCDFVVTQNSAAAFSGYFFGKPALFFARIDFHHIGIQADMADLVTSFAEVEALKSDYAAYLWWFWQDQSINAGRAEAEDKIALRLRRFGWPV